MTEDTYADLAARYDWMHRENPARRAFFRRRFAEHDVTRVLDCACGTGRDLAMFRELGIEVHGSDLSSAMLTQARAHLDDAVPLRQVDFCDLPAHFDTPFDAVVCLTNAINEVLDDAGTLRALQSMRAVLRPGGLLIFDQGQTDASMRDPARFAPVLNTRDWTRFFVIDIERQIQTVHIFDFVHTAATCATHHTPVRLRIRLLDSWRQMLTEAGFTDVAIYGDWVDTPYDKATSRRLIAVAIA